MSTTDPHDTLRQQNQILRNLVHTLATVVSEIFELLPEEFQTLENAQRAKDVSRKIITGLKQLNAAESEDHE